MNRHYCGRCMLWPLATLPTLLWAAPSPSLPTVTVVAPALSAPQHEARSRQILDEEHIARRQAAELADVIKRLPGVDASGGPLPLSARPSIRGLTGQRIVVQVDDVERRLVSDGSNNVSSIDLYGVDPDTLKQVEVRRGADSVDGGNGAIGGRFLFSTKNAHDFLDGNHGQGARVRWSRQLANDLLAQHLDAYSAGERHDLVLSLTRQRLGAIQLPTKSEHGSGSQDVRNDTRVDDGHLKLHYDASPASQWQGKLAWNSRESRDQPWRGQIGTPQVALADAGGGDFREGKLAHRWQPPGGPLRVDLTLFGSEQQYQNRTSGSYLRGSSRIPLDSVSDGKTRRHGLTAEAHYQLGGLLRQQWLARAGIADETFSQQQQDVSAPGSNTLYGSSDARDLFLSLKDTLYLGERLRLAAGARYDDFARDSSHFGKAADSKGRGSHSMELTWQPLSALDVFLRHSSAVRAPTLQEMYKRDLWRCHVGGKICYREPQPGLRAERARSAEAGFLLAGNALPWADHASLRLVAHQGRVRDLIDNVPFMYYLDASGNKIPGAPTPGGAVPMATHRDYSAKNIGLLHSRGLELQGEWRLRALSLSLGYSQIRMDAEGVPNFYLGTVEDKREPYTEAPADKLSLLIDYALSDSLALGASMDKARRMDRLPAIYRQLGYAVDGYTVYGAYLSWQPRGAIKGLRVDLALDNATNRHYRRAPAGGDGAELGRNLKASVAYRF